MKTNLNRFCDDVWETIDEWGKETSIKLSDSVLETAIESSKKIKELTPKRKGSKGKKAYRNCFTIRPNRNKNKTLMERTLYNTQYRLSHLLEDGHEVYTRTGKKTDPNAKKIGPLEIKRRTGRNGGTFAVANDNKHTVSYKNWKHTRDKAEEYLVDSIKSKFS